MGDIEPDKQSNPVRMVGGGTDDEENVAQVTPLKEVSTSDVLDNGGLDTILTVGTSPIELKVGITRKADRKLLMFTALDRNFSFGFSSLSQSFPLANGQTVILNVGGDIEVWVVNTKSGKSIAVGEF